ncbi:MAG: Fic family protein [Lachnospiraceae bacterium]|nr:Fic family protein [Lachnospiraceae bacterium]
MRQFDYSKLKSTAWDSEVLSLVAQIHEFKGRQEMYLAQKPAALERLVEIAKVQSTEASNKIEGIVTTSARIKQLCDEKTAPRNRDEEEISGYRDALNTIHENYEYIPLAPNYILQLHEMLYHYSGRGIGGRFKNVQNYISETRADGTSFVRFTPLHPYETPDAIAAICASCNKAIDDGIIDPLLLIPIFINDFLCIHPFNGGNGRMSRLLTTLLLYRSGYVVGRYVSLEAKIERNQNAYYDVLQTASIRWHEEDNNFVPFIKYLLGTILSACRDFEDRMQLADEKLPAVELVRRATQKKIGKFTKSEIMELCPSIKKASVENSLKKLVDNGVITRHSSGKNAFYTRNS